MGKLEDMAAKHSGAVEDSTGPAAPAATRPAAGGPAKKPAKFEGVAALKGASRIAIGRVAPDPDQPRKEFDREELELLAASLKEDGQEQPITVTYEESADVYLIVDGERRWRAANLAGLATIDAVVGPKPTPAERLRRQMVANVNRADLNDMEKARTLARLLEMEGWSKGELAGKLKMRPSQVSKLLALLTLEPEVQGMVEEGKLPSHTAYEMSGEAPEVQREVAAKVADQGLSREEAKAEVVKSRAARGEKPKAAGKGRGGSKKGAEGKTTNRVFNTGLRIRFTADSKRAFDLPALLAASREVTRLLEEEAGATAEVA